MTTQPGRHPATPPPGVALFAWVKQQLLDSIARGESSPDEPFITQREIVERYGVSTTTAVRALNELVADGVVVRRRGRGTFVAHRPPRAAGPDRRSLTYVGPGSTSVHELGLLSGLADECAALGYGLAIEQTREPAHEAEVLRRAAAGHTHGVVLFAHDGSVAAGAVEELRRAGVVVILVDRYFPALPTDAVIFDDFAVGYGVTTAVLDRGHRNVAVLWSEVDVTSVRDRLSGHYRALRDRGLPELPERSALRTYQLPDPAARRARLRALLDAADRSAAPLTALICGNGPTLALAAADLLAMESGFPGSVELASMDQSLPEDVSPLAVTAARLPTREMGRAAARLAHERLEGSTAPLRHLVLQAQVQVADRGQNVLGVIGAAPADPAATG